MKISKIMAVSAVALLAGAIGAQAATLSLQNPTGETQLIAGNDLGIGLNGKTIDVINGADKSALNGLLLSGGPAKLTFTYLGFEAGFENYAAGIGGALSFVNDVASVGDTVSFKPVGDGLVDFSFGTSAPSGVTGQIFNNGVAAPAKDTYAIGYYKISSTSFYVLFDDRAVPDRDFDDIGMRIDVEPIPVPAAGFLLLGGLGGLAALRRRQKKAS